jgi:RAT1-interacting protein
MGYKFEALCSAGVHGSAPVNANSEFCSAVRLRIANHRIVLMAEIDAMLQSSGGEPQVTVKNSYLELKTTKQPESDRDRETLYLNKYQKWFLQSYLAGVRTIFIGLRDDNGVLVDVSHVSTRSLSRAAKEFSNEVAKGGQPCWEPFVCINFIEYCCEHIRRACGEHPGQTIRFCFDPRQGLLTGRLLQGDTSFATRLNGLRV